MNRLSKIIIIPVLIAMVFVFSMSALAVIHTKWVAGDFIYYDGSDNIFAVRDDTDGVRVYDDMNLTFGDGDDDATIKWDEDGTDKLLITCVSGFTISGPLTFDSELDVVIAAPSAPVNAFHGVITASADWSVGNVVGVRGKVNISATGDVYSATGVWAGVDITSSYGGHGLVTGLNVEVSSTTAQDPNAIMYIQSLPKGANTDFSDVPYLVFSETVTAGGAVGSNILFEVGHAQARTIPTLENDMLFFQDTLRIAVNKIAGTRTKYYIPLSTDSGTFTTEYPIVATYGSGSTVSTSAVAITITDPLIDTVGEYIDGIYALINSTDAVGWTQGEVVAVRGESHLATLNPGSIISSFGGKFTLEFDSAFTAVGGGMTAGAYIGVINEYGGSAPCAVLYIEEITSGDGTQGNMPMVIMTSQGDTADKSPYAFSFGFAAAGTTVGSGTGEMFEGNTIQCIINGTPMFIPFSTVEASFTTAYPIASTSTTGYLSTAAFDPDSAYSDYGLAIGTYTSPLTVTFAATANENFNPIQLNFAVESTSTGPADPSQMNVIYAKIAHNHTDSADLRLKCADFTITTDKNIKDMYAYQGEIDLTGDVAIGGEATVLGLVFNAGTGTVTGKVRGLAIQLLGNGMPSANSMGLVVEAGTNADILDGIRVGACTGTSIVNAIHLNAMGGTTITYGMLFDGGGTFTTGIDLGDTCVTAIDIGTVTSYAINFTGNEGKILMGTAADDRASFASGSVAVFWTKSIATSGGSAGMHFDHAIGYQGETTCQGTALRGLLRILSGTTAGDAVKIYEGAAGYFSNEGNMNGSTLQIAGVRSCIVDGGGTYTEVSHLSSIWVDTQLDTEVTLGEYSLFRGTNNGATVLGQMISLYGDADYFLKGSGKQQEGGWYQVTATTSGEERGYLKVHIDGTAKRIKLWVDSD